MLLLLLYRFFLKLSYDIKDKNVKMWSEVNVGFRDRRFCVGIKFWVKFLSC